MTEVASSEAAPRTGGGLHQPWRLLVALAELLVAAAVVWAATLCWSAAITTLTVVAGDGTALVSRHYDGPLVAAAIGLGTVAGVLVVDAVRQLLLGTGTRRRRRA